MTFLCLLSKIDLCFPPIPWLSFPLLSFKSIYVVKKVAYVNACIYNVAKFNTVRPEILVAYFYVFAGHRQPVTYLRINTIDINSESDKLS